MTIVSWRPAQLRDALWWRRLRNEPQARANSLNNRRIGLLEHLWWYLRSLRSKDSCLYVGYERPVEGRAAQVRYQRTGEHATVSITVDQPFRGRGIGTAMLIGTRDYACMALNVKTLKALTLIENTASRRMLESAGYTCGALTMKVSRNDKRLFTAYTWTAT